MNAQINDINVATVFGQALPPEVKPVSSEPIKPVRVAQGNAQQPETGESGGPVDRETVEAAMEKLQNQFASKGISLKFKIADSSGGIQVEMVNTESEKVIRKLPPDELLKLSSSIKELAGGFLNRAI